MKTRLLFVIAVVVVLTLLFATPVQSGYQVAPTEPETSPTQTPIVMKVTVVVTPVKPQESMPTVTQVPPTVAPPAFSEDTAYNWKTVDISGATNFAEANVIYNANKSSQLPCEPAVSGTEVIGFKCFSEYIEVPDAYEGNPTEAGLVLVQMILPIKYSDVVLLTTNEAVAKAYMPWVDQPTQYKIEGVTYFLLPNFYADYQPGNGNGYKLGVNLLEIKGSEYVDTYFLLSVKNKFMLFKVPSETINQNVTAKTFEIQ